MEQDGPSGSAQAAAESGRFCGIVRMHAPGNPYFAGAFSATARTRHFFTHEMVKDGVMVKSSKSPGGGCDLEG